MSVRRDPDLGPEAYRLRVDADRIAIEAGSVLGAGHATVTLRQLLPPDAHRTTPIARAGWTAPCVRIADEPGLEWRGFMLDVARHFAPKDEVLQILDRMALHKLNRFHLHLTDDQGWRFASDAYPAIAEIASWRRETVVGGHFLDAGEPEFDGTPHGGIYSLDDLREITAHAAGLGIVVIPEIDLPAHASALLAAVPELRTPGTGTPEVLTRFGHSGRVVNPLPEGRAALATLIGELADAVSSPYLHLGGDEATLSDWEGSAAVSAYRAASGLNSTADLRVDLTRFLEAEVAALGRRAVVWEEAFQIGGLATDTVVMAWRAETLGLAAMAAGHDVVMCPVDGTYLDYADEPVDGLSIGSGQTVERVACYSPSRGAGPGRLLGVQAQLWTEFTPDARIRTARMFPRLAVRAAAAWSGVAVDWPAARPALAAHLERLAAAGVEYRPLDAPHPWQAGGTGRRQPTTSLTMDQVAHVCSNRSRRPSR